MIKRIFELVRCGILLTVCFFTLWSCGMFAMSRPPQQESTKIEHRFTALETEMMETMMSVHDMRDDVKDLKYYVVVVAIGVAALSGEAALKFVKK